ncbi:MAG: hypothetical protein H0X24_09625 [Ktedonobacterales bacterium]|nr:hypothetical protein [Ktedonobacterales bacterium]
MEIREQPSPLFIRSTTGHSPPLGLSRLHDGRRLRAALLPESRDNASHVRLSDAPDFVAYYTGNVSQLAGVRDTLYGTVLQAQQQQEPETVGRLVIGLDPLNTREIGVLLLVEQEYSNQDSVHAVDISPKFVKKHSERPF